MNHYFSVRLIGGAGHGPQHLVPKLVETLHDVLVNSTDQIALALPRAKEGEKPKLGNVVQFFSNDKDALEQLADRIDDRSELADLIAVERIKSVPEPVSRWAAYTRYRLPSRKKGKKDHDEFYARKMKERAEKASEMQQLPVIFMASKSNDGGRFGMGVKAMHAETGPSETGKLNGYGLSSRSNPVWVPVLQ
jgi:CRISPR-associated endoribonuclease Cas6/Csy4 subtype I-F